MVALPFGEQPCQDAADLFRGVRPGLLSIADARFDVLTARAQARVILLLGAR
jgi:hypothetical protein